MRMFKNVLFMALVAGLSLELVVPQTGYTQKKGKGDLEDFADDFGEEEDSDSGDSEEAIGFFIEVMFHHLVHMPQLWGGTPETENGPYPSFPYAGGDGFMATSNQHRSYFFTTEFNYHYINEDLRSYIVKWETQFMRRSKLSFDLAVYEEDRIDDFGFIYKDHLTFFGFRYGYALFNSPQMILNLEGGLRGFHRNSAHSGPEIALDLQLFPKRPFILETEIAAAYVSNGMLLTVESSAGIAIGRFEILGGVRILKNKSSDLLDGFRVGLRVWY